MFRLNKKKTFFKVKREEKRNGFTNQSAVIYNNHYSCILFIIEL